jgi:hypothetical protein
MINKLKNRGADENCRCRRPWRVCPCRRSHELSAAGRSRWLRTVFLGPAVPVEAVVAAAEREQADLVGVSYRLTPETGAQLLGAFAEAADELRAAGTRFVFGGTPPVAERARSTGFFERAFDGSEPDATVLAYLNGQIQQDGSTEPFPQTTVARIAGTAPFPLLRHH